MPNFSFAKFHRKHEQPLYAFIVDRLGHNLHVTDQRGITMELPPERLRNAAADITVEVFVQMYQLCRRQGWLSDEGTINDEEREELRGALYGAASWLCDGP